MGGNAIPGVGKIHNSELSPTLWALAKDMNYPMSSFTKNLLGSVGKKEYSGDIDIAVAYESDEKVGEFTTYLWNLFGEDNVVRHGRNVHLKYPIYKYDVEEQDQSPRTGYVQVDFLFGDVELMKIYSYAPSEHESDYTGTHRNLGIISICRWLDRKDSEELDTFGRPIETVRWKWSPKIGLQKVIRRSVVSKVKENKWNVKQVDENIGLSFTDKRGIVDKLFSGTGELEQIDTLENIINGVKRRFSVDTQEKIFKTMAEEFTNHRRLSKYTWSYPPEIDKYL